MGPKSLGLWINLCRSGHLRVVRDDVSGVSLTSSEIEKRGVRTVRTPRFVCIRSERYTRVGGLHGKAVGVLWFMWRAVFS